MGAAIEGISGRWTAIMGAGLMFTAVLNTEWNEKATENNCRSPAKAARAGNAQRAAAKNDASFPRVLGKFASAQYASRHPRKKAGRDVRRQISAMTDEISTAALRYALAARLEEAFTLRQRRGIVEWAEAEMRMGGGKPFRVSYAPYQREMLEAPFDPDVVLTAFMIFSRGGKTEVAKAIMGYHMAEDPCHELMMRSTVKKAEKFGKDFMADTVAPSPGLRRLIKDGGRSADASTLRMKRFPGGTLELFGSNSPGELRESKGRLLIADEVDTYEIGSDGVGEGDILPIFWKRGDEYPDTKKLAMSYPSLSGRSRIDSLMRLSDYRKWHVPCAKCGEYFVMLREQIKSVPGMPETAVLECPKCANSLTDKHRREMMMAGEWRPTQSFQGIRGYWANSLLWPHPTPDKCRGYLHFLAKKVEDITGSDDAEKKMQVLVNTEDALPYQPPRTTKPDWQRIMERRETYPTGMLPEGVLWLSAGIDVQNNWIEVDVVGYGLNGHSWAIRHFKLPGSTKEPAAWDRLLAELHKCAWPVAGGGTLRVLRGDGKAVPKVLIDSRFAPDIVLRWAHKNRFLGIFACEGLKDIQAPLVGKKRMHPTLKATIYGLGVNQGKHSIYQGLMQEDASGHGYMHFPMSHEYDGGYFQGLLSEEGSEEMVNGIRCVRYVKPTSGTRNEPLDTRNYANAAFQAAKPALEALATQKRREIRATVVANPFV